MPSWASPRQLQCRLGYYGGAINGATVHVEYTTGTDGYVYAIAAIAADHAIVFAYESSGPTLYVKQNGSWAVVSRAYRKVSGAWQEVALDSAFSGGTRYRRA